jgi:hypothetical protein
MGWEENAAAEFDSALNNWRDLIPEHCMYLPPIEILWGITERGTVRWDPARADPVFFDQSVALHCKYYHLQIFIHRPFIPMVRKSASTVGVVFYALLAIGANNLPGVAVASNLYKCGARVC